MHELERQEEALPTTTDEVTSWVEAAPAADVAATAGWWLRRLGELEAEIAKLEAREEAELARVRAHYAAQRAPMESRAGEFRRAVEAVAAAYRWGKKKSLQLTWGTFGVRTKPARVEVVDQAKAVEWARQHAPDAVVVKETVAQKVVAPRVLALVAESGEEVEGFCYHPELEQPYATPSSLALAGGPDGDQ